MLSPPVVIGVQSMRMQTRGKHQHTYRLESLQAACCVCKVRVWWLRPPAAVLLM